jgi:DNA modification methylase
MKMVRGENTYGHTAPYPEEIPALLARFIPQGGRVVDPFGGSGTTARALCPHGIHVVCVERDPGYCDLAVAMGDGVKSRENTNAAAGAATHEQLPLFASPAK